MKKILYNIFTDKYPNQFSGGPNNIIYKIINYFDNKFYKFGYLSSDLYLNKIDKKKINDLQSQLNFQKKTAELLRNNSLFYQKITSSDFYLSFHFWKKNNYFKRMSKSIRGVDIFHAKDSISLKYFKDYPTKKIMTIHSKGPLSSELKEVTKNLYLKNKIENNFRKVEIENISIADIITFPSYAAKVFFEKDLEVELPEEKIKIIYNGIDTEYINSIEKNKSIFNKFNIKKNNSKVLLNVADHAPEKNIDLLISVIDKLVNEYNKDYILINIGQLNQTHLNKVEELNLGKNIFFLNKIHNEDVIKFLKVCDVFIMVSSKVIFDLVVLEALASGACCLVSNNGGNKEIIEDGKNGFLVNIDNTSEIVKKIISIRPQDVKKNAISTADQFTVKKMVNSYFSLYEDILNGI